MNARPAQTRVCASRRGAAFSLIELLLVLVILSVLAALIVPRFVGTSARAHITAAKTDIAALGTALNKFEIENGRFPNSQEGLQALVEQPAGLTTWTQCIEQLKNDPWGHPYQYRNPGQHNTNGYDLYSFGPDGQDGTDDDVTNWSENTNN